MIICTTDPLGPVIWASGSLLFGGCWFSLGAAKLTLDFLKQEKMGAAKMEILFARLKHVVFPLVFCGQDRLHVLL